MIKTNSKKKQISLTKRISLLQMVVAKLYEDVLLLQNEMIEMMKGSLNTETIKEIDSKDKSDKEN